MVLLAVRIEGLATTEARLGRTAANALRRKVAVRLRVGLRAGDVVAALGPDLLGVLLPRVQDPHDAERVAAKLVLALKASFSLAGDEVTVAVAIGAAHYPRDGKDADLLLRRAIGLAAATQAVGRAGFADALERGTCLPDAANDAA
jgi:GGDEF domain-containing protein